jgi:raffinose/stachyose/melibiose transport system permease protein
MSAAGREIARPAAATAVSRQRRRWLGYAFVAPALLLHLAIVGVPSIVTFGLSTFDWDGFKAPQFIGLANFVEILTKDDVFFRAFTNNLRWLAIFLVLPAVAGMTAAAMVATLGKSQFVYRTVYFLPYIFPSVVVARMFNYLYHPFYGLNLVFKQIGLPGLAQSWLGNPATALYAILNASQWHFWGFDFMVFLAALQQIDRNLYEAASVEGANRWQTFRYITVPLLRPTLIFILLMTTLWSFNAFDYVYVMSQGGPAHSTELLATWIYGSAVAGHRAGYASALAVTLTLISSGVIVAYVWMRRRGMEA